LQCCIALQDRRKKGKERERKKEEVLHKSADFEETFEDKKN
jgi:hypothetical protein